MVHEIVTTVMVAPSVGFADADGRPRGGHGRSMDRIGGRRNGKRADHRLRKAILKLITSMPMITMLMAAPQNQ